MSVATAIVPGTYTIDRAHSEVGFSVRHLGLSKVRGRFTDFDAAITLADDPLASSVEAIVRVASVTTNDAQRDGHLLSSDFFEVETFPVFTFRSTGLRHAGGDDYELAGELTIKGITREVTFDLEFAGTETDPQGVTRAGFSASTEISRKDYGMEFNMVLDSGGLLVGDKVKVILEIEAVKTA